MEVTFDHDMSRDMMDVYVRTGHGYMIYSHLGDNYFESQPGAEIRPYWSIPFPVYSQIMRAALGPTPTDDVVRDVRNTRDRMIALVERMIP